MRIEGNLVPNSDILVIFEQQEGDPQPWEYGSETTQWITESPTGANIQFFKTDIQGNVYTFRTDTAGNYSFRGHVTLINDYSGNQPLFDEVFETASTTIAAAPVQQIIQTHTLVDNEEGSCSNVGVLITANYPFNNVNGIPIPSTSSYRRNKGRQDEVMFTIEATDPAQGTHSLLSSQKVPYMPDVFSSGDYLDVEVTLGVSPNLYTYNFGVGYQSLNKYSYPQAGLYVIQIKDTYGCIKQITYQANEPPVVSPTEIPDEFYLSKANSLRYVEVVEHDNCAIYQTDENTFDKDIKGLDINYEYNQRVKKCNDLKTQFKSNLAIHTAEYYNVTTKQGPFPMTIEKVQSNLLAQDVRFYNRFDDEVYSYVYFEDGLLPWFYLVGSDVIINGDTRRIIGFTELEDQNALALKVSKLSGLINAGTVNYVYNKQSYDVYEYNLPVTSNGLGCYYIVLKAEKNSVVRTFQTPTFKVGDSFEQSLDIMYYSRTNTDMYYGSEIKNFLTLGYESRVPLVDAALEVVKADYTNYLKSSFNVEKFEIKFEPLTLENMRKLVIALCHEKLFIDSTGYAVDTIELETPEPTTNLYVVTAAMSKSNQNVRFISTNPIGFTWASGQVTFDNSITIDRTTL